MMDTRPSAGNSETSNMIHQQTPAGTSKTNIRKSGSESEKDFTQKLHAVIIGINTYPNLDHLKGAVTDADNMESFLRHELGVPAEHIVTLRNEQATRSHIIQEFRKLWNNPGIQRGDPILIYFAGHGGQAKANKEWRSRYGSQQIQVIFPYNYNNNGAVLGSTKSVKINCIPDRTIATLLNKLAFEKGNNITVIFDSCHSASGTRAITIRPGRKANGRDRQYRNATVGGAPSVDLDIPHDIDDDLLALYGIGSFPERQQRDAQLLLHTDQASHIHFAACGIHEMAAEEYGRGVFTDAFLRRIRESGPDNITYHNLIKCLPIESSDQSPQCYGKHKHRILFNSRISLRKVPFVSVMSEDSNWILRAGDASGVTLGSKWDLYKTSTENSEPIGRFEVTDLFASDAILEPLDSDGKSLKGNDDTQMYARCVRVGGEDRLALGVWASPDDLKLLFGGAEYKGKSQKGGIGYRIMSNRDDAQVALEVCPHNSTLLNGTMAGVQMEVIFHLCNDLAKRHKADRLPQRRPALKEEVEIVLFAAARWHWHLRRGDYNSLMSISMWKVSKKSIHGRAVNRLSKPEPVCVMVSTDGASSRTDASINLPLVGTVKLKVDSSLYGFNCSSKIDTPLYVRMFYFNASDFSIVDLFGHNTGIGVNTPNVPAHGELLIGDGADGGSAIRFSLPPGQQVELGYMKVFWSTKPLELDYIKQKSVLKIKRAADLFGDIAAERWGTACLALVLEL